jgi:hypothetical protein
VHGILALTVRRSLRQQVLRYGWVAEASLDMTA